MDAQQSSKSRAGPSGLLNTIAGNKIDKRHGTSTSMGRGNADNMSTENSTLIKQNIKRTMYSAFPDLKEQETTMGRLGQMQAKAQLDALKRFIKGMEKEIVDNKHIAQDKRRI